MGIVMVGTFPPPIHGMSAVNLAVRDRLKEGGETPLAINTAASNLDRSLISRLKRLPRAIKGILKLVVLPMPRGSTLYMSLSGGWGQVYELAFLIVARLRRMRIFLHHHSYAYLDRPRLISRFLMFIAGSQAMQVALSPRMTERLKEAYPRVKKATSVSNAVFLLHEASGLAHDRTHLGTLGFLGNIAAEKGVFEFLDVCKELQTQGFSLKAKLAGPFQDDETEHVVRQRLEDLPMVEYLGPVYGVDKEAFFAAIDVLLFPTRYVNEAEPLTIHEAMMHGVPVIAYGRGAIPEIVSKDAGLVIGPEAAFVPAALTQINAWIDKPESFAACSHSASHHFVSLMNENRAHWHILCNELLANPRNMHGKGHRMNNIGF